MKKSERKPVVDATPIGLSLLTSILLCVVGLGVLAAVAAWTETGPSGTSSIVGMICLSGALIGMTVTAKLVIDRLLRPLDRLRAALDDDDEAGGDAPGSHDLVELREAIEEFVEREAQAHAAAVERYRTEAAAAHADADRARMECDEALATSQWKSELLATISQQMREPLRSISASASQLTVYPLDEVQAESVGNVHERTGGLLDLVDDLHCLSLIESGQVTAEPQIYSPSKLAGQLIEQICEHIDIDDLELLFEIGPDLPDTIVGDPARVHETLLHLLNHAVRDTERGTVTLLVEGSNWNGKRCVRYVVADSRSAEDSQAHLEAVDVGARGGAGLGFVICKRLIDLMQGSIRMSSEPATGTTVFVSLPDLSVEGETYELCPLDALEQSLVDGDQETSPPRDINQSLSVASTVVQDGLDQPQVPSTPDGGWPPYDLIADIIGEANIADEWAEPDSDNEDTYEETIATLEPPADTEPLPRTDAFYVVDAADAAPTDQEPDASAEAEAEPIAETPDASAEAEAEGPDASAEADAEPIAEMPDASTEADAEPIAEVPDAAAEADAEPIAEAPDASAEAEAEPEPTTEVPDAAAEAEPEPEPTTEMPDAAAEADAEPTTEMPDAAAEAEPEPTTEVPDAAAEAQAEPEAIAAADDDESAPTDEDDDEEEADDIELDVETELEPRPARILIVDDNPGHRTLMTRYLMKLGYEEPRLAENGQECLTLLQREPFDLVLLDMQMPVMNGYDTARAIRKNPELVDYPIIAVTANSMLGDTEHCMNAGCSDYLAKPFHRSDLAEVVERHLPPELLPQANSAA